LPLDIEGWFARYGPMVVRRCRALLRDDNEARDAAQDVFVSLLRHEDALSDTAPAALLLRVATNVSLNRLRARRRRPEDRDEERLHQIAALDDGAVEERTLARSVLGRLFRADDPLAASTRTIAVMHLLDGLTLEEVARESGLSVSGVRKRLRTLRARLTDMEEARS
jgi:RNA polymerase sigma factor (sigma-70 family)